MNDLLDALRHPSRRVRAEAARTLIERCFESDEVRQVDLLAHILIGEIQGNWDPVLRLGEAARPALLVAVQDDDPVIRREATEALRVLDSRLIAAEGTAILQTAVTRRSGLKRFLRKSEPSGLPNVLILTPLKDAEAFIPGYYQRLTQLTYPKNRISLAFLEGDSKDSTFAEVNDRLPRFRKHFRRAELWKRDYGFNIPAGVARWAQPIQVQRRSILAKSRNYLLSRALDDEDWVLWLDVDVIEYPPDIIERLVAAQKDIIQPHCVLEYGGATYDHNAWRDRGQRFLPDLREEGEVVELHGVGGTMLLVRADIHREGLIFPVSPYGKGNPLAREQGEIETEGLGIMARDMGYRCWGMPRLEIRHGRW